MHRFPPRLAAGLAVIGLSLAASLASASTVNDAANAMENVPLLTQIGLIEGHLTVGSALYQDGAQSHAVMHMKHPQDELYAALAPALAARKIGAFDRELTGLADAVENDRGKAAVAEASQTVMRALAKARTKADATPLEKFEIAEALLREAAEEFGIGVQDGKINDLHEYQDAWGFTQVARRILTDLAASGDEAVAAQASKALDALTATVALWPSIDGGTPGGDASVLYGAAARIEIAALPLH